MSVSNKNIKCCQTLSKEKKKRKVMIQKNILSTDEEWNLLQEWETNNPSIRFLLSQIQNKLSSYKYQDISKQKFVSEYFITLPQTMNLLIQSQLQCEYCHQKCRLLYENVRDSLQWSLDRIDNDQGHNIGNVVLSCLGCNLKRKTTFYRKFLYTKQVVISKMGMGET